MNHCLREFVLLLEGLHLRELGRCCLGLTFLRVKLEVGVIVLKNEGLHLSLLIPFLKFHLALNSLHLHVEFSRV
jgi:hypothetical protein